MTSPASIYAAARDQFVAELRSLSPDDAATMIPSCPEWSAKDVLAHVSGLVADLLAGVKPPLGTDEMTARQVGERAAMSPTNVCDEWVENGPGIEAFFDGRELYALGLTADLAVHIHDLAEELDGISPPPAEATLAGCERYVPLLQERVAERLDVALEVTLDGQRWAPAAGNQPLALSATPTEFLRSVTGRRTSSQVEALDWSGDASAVLDQAFTQYGPYRVESVS